MTVAPVILAAGASTRLGQPKALARLGGIAVIDRMLDALAAAGLGAPLIVTGAHDREIRAHLLERPQEASCEVCHNPSWALGRTGGVQLAVENRRGENLLIWPADVPLVEALTLKALGQTFERQGHGPLAWLAPSFRPPLPAAGDLRYGHPVVIGAALGALALSLPQDAPLRSLRGLAGTRHGMECTDLGVLDDLDTETDLARLEARLDELS